MKFLRSFAVVALAMCASVLMVVPSHAAVPIDPGLAAVAVTHEAYPAPVIQNVDRLLKQCEATVVSAALSPRSSLKSKDLRRLKNEDSNIQPIEIRWRC